MPKRRKDMAFEESLFNNMDDYTVFLGRFLDLACGCFNFENLPKEVYKPFVINYLIKQGQVLAFEDEDLLTEEGKPTFFLYPFLISGALDPYMRPRDRQVVLFNNSAKYTRDETNSEILRANVSGTNLFRVIEYFARNIYLINRTIQINVNAQKTPVALKCSENERLTYTNLLKQYQGNVPFIFGDKGLDLSALTSVNLQAPFVSDKLYNLMENYWNQFLTFFGIPNISINKKERLITDEVQQKMGGVLVARQNFENQIQDDIERINDRFGLDIKFTWGVKPTPSDEVDNELYNGDITGMEKGTVDISDVDRSTKREERS